MPSLASSNLATTGKSDSTKVFLAVSTMRLRSASTAKTYNASQSGNMQEIRLNYPTFHVSADLESPAGLLQRYVGEVIRPDYPIDVSLNGDK